MGTHQATGDRPARVPAAGVVLEIAAAALAVATLAVTALGLHGPAPFAVALAFLVLGPSTAVLALLRRPGDPPLEPVVVGALGLSLAVIAGTLAVLTGLWEPRWWLAGAALATLAGLLAARPQFRGR